MRRWRCHAQRHMTTVVDTMHGLLEQDPAGASWLPTLLHRLPEIHWGALRQPGAIQPAESLARDVPLIDGPVHLACCIETDTLVLTLEDARHAPLPTGLPSDPARHHVSRAIEAARAIAGTRYFGVVIVANDAGDEPHRTTILEGLPHLEREEAEDLYANYWGCIRADALETLLRP